MQEREKILNNQTPKSINSRGGKKSTNAEEGGNVFNMLNAKKTSKKLIPATKSQKLILNQSRLSAVTASGL